LGDKLEEFQLPTSCKFWQILVSAASHQLLFSKTAVGFGKYWHYPSSSLALKKKDGSHIILNGLRQLVYY
jgi:hypothetical protein